MTTENSDTHMENQQILQETVFNERIVEHPTLGRIKLRVPNLAIQRKVDAVVRNRRKALLSAYEQIEDPENPGQMIRVPSFKSKDELLKEYATRGWWSPEQEAERERLSQEQVRLITELELLGFTSDEDIIQDLVDIRDELIQHFAGVETEPDFDELIIQITTPGVEAVYEDLQRIRASATSTSVDDALDMLNIKQRTYQAYASYLEVTSDAVSLEAEYNNLFADSWQEQLQYYQRLAQLFYCTENAETGERLWKDVMDIENDISVDNLRWLFNELTMFWQGVSDEARERIAKYDFQPRLAKEEAESSEDSQGQPTSNLDGDLPENEPIPSTPVTGIQENLPIDTLTSPTG